MTLSTHIKIITEVDQLEIFKLARSILSIPEYVGYHYSDIFGVGTIWSNPCGADAMLIVGPPGSLSQDWLDECREYSINPGPLKWMCHINLDTAYGYTGRHGDCSGVHDHFIQELMNRRPELEFWANNEFDGTWHKNSLPYT